MLAAVRGVFWGPDEHFSPFSTTNNQLINRENERYEDTDIIVTWKNSSKGEEPVGRQELINQERDEAKNEHPIQVSNVDIDGYIDLVRATEGGSGSASLSAF